jgi:hypothetical protein
MARFTYENMVVYLWKQVVIHENMVAFHFPYYLGLAEVL